MQRPFTPGAAGPPSNPARGRRVFVRPEALALRRPGDRSAIIERPAPDADRAIDTLEAFGYEVIMLQHGAPETDLAPRDWLLTADADDCRWARRAGGRTVLVGADATEQAGQPDRCDRTVNSVYSAAIEVVISEPRDGSASDGWLGTEPGGSREDAPGDPT
jgi:hypothetical protein